MVNYDCTDRMEEETYLALPRSEKRVSLPLQMRKLKAVDAY